MYKVKSYVIPEGYRLSEYASLLAKEIQNGKDVEINKDKLFRATYPVLFKYAMQFKNLASEEDLISDMAIAFTKTLNNFNPEATTVSFINYYKMATRTEIFNNEYGKYKRNEETRKLKSKFEGTMESLETSIQDKHGVNTGTWHDLIPDNKFIIDKTMMNKEFRKDLEIAIDKVFKKATDGPRSIKSRKLLEAYLQNVLSDRPIIQKELAAKHGVTRSAVNNVAIKYLPRLKDELIKLGY